jgi:hypothetical protein
LPPSPREYLQKEEERLQKEMAELLSKAESTDAAEDDLHGRESRGDELPALWGVEEMRRKKGSMKSLRAKLQSARAFSLIELLVVTDIIAIPVGVLMPAIALEHPARTLSKWKTRAVLPPRDYRSIVWRKVPPYRRTRTWPEDPRIRRRLGSFLPRVRSFVVACGSGIAGHGFP